MMPDAQPNQPRIKRACFLTVGLVLLGIGGVGVVVPGLPTFMFWVFAAVCFGRSCPALEQWVYNRPRLGPAIRLYVQQHAMTAATRRRALIGMWAGMTASACLILALGRPSWIAVAIGLCGVGVTVYLFRGVRRAEELHNATKQTLDTHPLKTARPANQNMKAAA